MMSLHGQGIHAGSTVLVENHNATKSPRRTQTDPHLPSVQNLRSGSVTDEYGAAYEGGLYRPAQPNVVKLKQAGTQTEAMFGGINVAGDQYAILTDEEDEGVEVEEVEFASRGQSCERGTSVGCGQSNLGLGVAGDEAVGGVPLAVLGALDRLDANIDADCDIDGPNIDLRVGAATKNMSTNTEMSGALMPQKGKRKVREALAELEDEAGGQQPVLKKTSH